MKVSIRCPVRSNRSNQSHMVKEMFYFGVDASAIPFIQPLKVALN